MPCAAFHVRTKELVYWNTLCSFLGTLAMSQEGKINLKYYCLKYIKTNFEKTHFRCFSKFSGALIWQLRGRFIICTVSWQISRITYLQIIPCNTMGVNIFYMESVYKLNFYSAYKSEKIFHSLIFTEVINIKIQYFHTNDFFFH